jgi:Raf kinase inhibitor-like YbhB/YbcL family protein
MPHGQRLIIVFLALALSACSKAGEPPADTLAVITDTGGQSQQIDHSAHSAMTFNLSSPAFPPNGSIPAKYTCEGADISPPLEWASAPSGAKTFALIVDDPDAPDPAKPQRVYVHWVVYNIPASTTKLPENASKSGLPSGAAQGINDFGKQIYGGPCPPIGRHRYFFKLYALDTELTGLNKPNKAQVEKAMQGRTIGNGQLIGTYQKAKP